MKWLGVTGSWTFHILLLGSSLLDQLQDRSILFVVAIWCSNNVCYSDPPGCEYLLPTLTKTLTMLKASCCCKFDVWTTKILTMLKLNWYSDDSPECEYLPCLPLFRSSGMWIFFLQVALFVQYFFWYLDPPGSQMIQASWVYYSEPYISSGIWILLNCKYSRHPGSVILSPICGNLCCNFSSSPSNCFSDLRCAIGIWIFIVTVCGIQIPI